MIEQKYLENEASRNDLARTESLIEGFLEYRSNISEKEIEKLAVLYKNKFHDAGADSVEFKLCRGTRTWLDQLDRWGKMIKEKKVDKNILFNIIGKAFEIDYPALLFIIEGHRLAHPDMGLYKNIELLKDEYDGWKKRQKRL